MPPSGGSWAIKNQAEKLAAEHGFTALPICPKTIAERAGIMIMALPSDVVSCSGRLIRHGDDFGIMYATYVQSEGFQRFSIAHELGHYFLEGHPEAVVKDGMHESNAGYASTSKYEREADTFAAALLMPEDLFKAAARVRSFGLAGLTDLANLCLTSLTSTAFRWVELTSSPCAVVMTDGSMVLSASFSEAMKNAMSCPWMKDRPIPAGTITHEFVSDRERIAAGESTSGASLASDWFGTDTEVRLREEVIGLGSYGRTLTLVVPAIRIEDDFDPEDEAEDEEYLVDRWTPRFRR